MRPSGWLRMIRCDNSRPIECGRGGRAGFAISYGLGQGATLIAALWGVFVWREFKNPARGVTALLTLMFVCFIAGLGVIVLSRTIG